MRFEIQHGRRLQLVAGDAERGVVVVSHAGDETVGERIACVGIGSRQSAQQGSQRFAFGDALIGEIDVSGPSVGDLDTEGHGRHGLVDGDDNPVGGGKNRVSQDGHFVGISLYHGQRRAVFAVRGRAVVEFTDGNRKRESLGEIADSDNPGSLERGLPRSLVSQQHHVLISTGTGGKILIAVTIKVHGGDRRHACPNHHGVIIGSERAGAVVQENRHVVGDRVRHGDVLPVEAVQIAGSDEVRSDSGGKRPYIVESAVTVV